MGDLLLWIKVYDHSRQVSHTDRETHATYRPTAHINLLQAQLLLTRSKLKKNLKHTDELSLSSSQHNMNMSCN